MTMDIDTRATPWRDPIRIVSATLAAVASAWILVLMVAICADVLAGHLAGQPIYGVVEVTGKSVVALVFFQVAHCLQSGRMTRADFVIESVRLDRPAVAAALETVYAVLGAAVFAAIAMEVWPLASRTFASGEYFGARSVFTAPIWPVHAAVLIGAGLAALAFARLGLRHAGELRRAGRGAVAGTLLGVTVCAVLLWGVEAADLSRPALGAVGVALLIVAVVMGMHIPVAVMLAGALGIWALRDNPNVAMTALRSSATGSVDGFAFGVVPLFVLMGLLLDRSGVGRDAFRVAASGLRSLPGGLGISTVAANAVFAAITGISIASAAVFSRVAIPPMVAAGYPVRMAAGCVAGSSVLGMLIPPSLLLIIFGFVSETSVGALFIAAIVPGIVLALGFAALILVAALRSRRAGGWAAAPPPGDENDVGIGASLALLAPIAGLVALVLGGIYGGLFTPTQAGAVGAAAALVLALARRRMSARDYWQVATETGAISATVLILVIAASMMTKMLAMSTLPAALLGWVSSAGLPFMGFMLGYLLVIVLLGMILDSTSIILVMVPLVIGVVQGAGAVAIGPDVMIWFGIVTIVAVEIGLLTPPFGITVYVVRAALPEGMATLWDVFAGAAPYALVMALVTGLLMLVPALAMLGV